MKVKIGKYRKNDKKRRVEVKIHRYDTWSMDHTLALIIHPMLVQLKEKNHGYFSTESEDAPGIGESVDDIDDPDIVVFEEPPPIATEYDPFANVVVPSLTADPPPPPPGFEPALEPLPPA